MKPYSFYFHYNKPASKSAGHNILTIHYQGKCHLVHDIVCNVPIRTRKRKTQPRCVIAGKGVLTIKDNIGIIDSDNSLEKEIERLKAGRFTEEEFQNLCHTFSEDDECRFKAGCVEYHKKLFGDKNGRN